MKNLLLLIVLIMVSHTCLCAVESEITGGQLIRKLGSCNSETNMYEREGFFDEEANKLLKKEHVANDKKSVSTLSDYVTLSGNVLTHCCFPRVACVGILSVMSIYCIFYQLTYGI